VAISGNDADGKPASEAQLTEPLTSIAAARSSLARLRAWLARIAQAMRDDAARPLTRNEKIALALLVAVPMVFTAIGLLSELTIPVPSLNDDALHYLFIQNASNAIANGQFPLDHWLPQIETGFPVLYYYQPLPELAVVVVQRVSLGALDLFTAFNLVRYVLLVGFPLTVFVSMRMMRFSVPACAIAAAASTLLAGNFRTGFEYDSYIWRGWGVYTQLWAMHLSFLTIAATYRAVQDGKRLWLAALLFGLLVPTHLILAYMTAIGVLVIALWGINRENFVARVVRVAIIGAFAAAISEYMWLPFLTSAAFLDKSPYLNPQMYDSYGAGPILSGLVSGDMLDHGRLPVLTVLLCAGVLAAVVSRSRVALVSLGLFVVWLVLYFGRPTLGVLTDLIPLHDSLVFYRFIDLVDLAAILFIGVGGAVLWHAFKPNASTLRLGAAVIVMLAVLAPAISERLVFYADNTRFQQSSMDALKADPDVNAIISTLESLPPGRVYAGLPSDFGSLMSFGDLHFYNLLTYYGIDALTPPTESMSLNADYIWDFDYHQQGDFDLYNVRYMVAPTGMAVPSFLVPIQHKGRYLIYQAPTTGYAEYVQITTRLAIPNQAELFRVNLAWERTHAQPGERLFIRYDYPASTVGVDFASTAACPGGGKTDSEKFESDSISLVVECSADSTLVIKTTYHPDWNVYVDGVLVKDFMVSPSYIGISLPAGKHTVEAIYRADPIKAPLVFVGMIAAVFLLLSRGMLDRFAERSTTRRRRAETPAAD
jgi:hypothetical protein